MQDATLFGLVCEHTQFALHTHSNAKSKITVTERTTAWMHTLKSSRKVFVGNRNPRYIVGAGDGLRKQYFPNLPFQEEVVGTADRTLYSITGHEK